MRWTFDDGGRTAAGFRGGAGDCVTRSVAIALALPYREVYDALHDAIAADRAAHGRARRNQRRSSPRTGVHTPVVRAFLADRGWLWTPTMSIGSGTTVHLRDGELPDAERLIARCSGHHGSDRWSGARHPRPEPWRHACRVRLLVAEPALAGERCAAGSPYRKMWSTRRVTNRRSSGAPLRSRR